MLVFPANKVLMPVLLYKDVMNIKKKYMNRSIWWSVLFFPGILCVLFFLWNFMCLLALSFFESWTSLNLIGS